MASSPVIYATKSFPKGAANNSVPYDAFSLNRSLLEQEDLLRVAIMVAQNFLKEPHGAVDTKKVQTALREDEEEILKLASFINTIPDPEAREALTARYDRLQKQITAMDLRLEQDRLASMQSEAKSPLTRLFFLVGFPAGMATTARAFFDAVWVIAPLTASAAVVGVYKAYEPDIKKTWDKMYQTTCSGCENESCFVMGYGKSDMRPKLSSVMRVMKCRREKLKGNSPVV